MRPDDWLAYVAPFPFPWGTAGSRRILGVALSLAHAGQRVFVLSGSPKASPETIHVDPISRGRVVHIALGELATPGSGRLRKAVRYVVTWGRQTVTWLDAQHVKPNCVIVYGGGAQYAQRLRRWCRANGVLIVADVVEWYSPKQFRGGRLGPGYLSAMWALKREYPRFDGVIVISDNLRRRYEAHGVPTIIVPPTVDNTTARKLPEARDRLQLLYFGTPGRKDSLWEVLRAVSTLEHQVELLVAGPTPQEIRALNPGGIVPRNVRLLGHVPQDRVAEVVGAADFTVLARADAPNTRAGFPTKIVESLAAGTPVITNLTGDLGLYLQDGREAFLAASGSAAAIRGAINRALDASKEDRIDMRRRAKESAGQFDYRGYVAPLGGWLNGLERSR